MSTDPLQKSKSPASLSSSFEGRGQVERLLRENYPGLRLLILKSTHNESFAADLLNDAVAVALEHLQAGRISQPQQIAGYVYQVSMNLLRNHRRKMDERAEARADPEVLDRIAGEQVDSLGEAAIAKQVRELIQSLSTYRDRDLVQRVYLDEEEKDALCRDLKLSPLHFDKVIFRARQRMKAILQKRGAKPADFFLLVCAA